MGCEGRRQQPVGDHEQHTNRWRPQHLEAYVGSSTQAAHPTRDETNAPSQVDGVQATRIPALPRNECSCTPSTSARACAQGDGVVETAKNTRERQAPRQQRPQAKNVGQTLRQRAREASAWSGVRKSN